MVGGELSGAQHLVEAAPLLLLLVAAWRYPAMRSIRDSEWRDVAIPQNGVVDATRLMDVAIARVPGYWSDPSVHEEVFEITDGWPLTAGARSAPVRDMADLLCKRGEPSRDRDLGMGGDWTAPRDSRYGAAQYSNGAFWDARCAIRTARAGQLGRRQRTRTSRCTSKRTSLIAVRTRDLAGRRASFSSIMECVTAKLALSLTSPAPSALLGVVVAHFQSAELPNLHSGVGVVAPGGENYGSC